MAPEDRPTTPDHDGRRRGHLVLVKLGTHSVRRLALDPLPKQAGDRLSWRQDEHGTRWSGGVLRGIRDGVYFVDRL